MFCDVDFGHEEVPSFARAKRATHSRRCIWFGVQVGEQPHVRLVDGADAAVYEEATPAKGRHLDRLDTE